MSRSLSDTVVGRITSVFGVKGWVKVHSYTEPMENILGYKSWRLHHNGVSRDVKLLDGKVHGRGLIAQLDGVSDCEQARALCGAEIVIDKSHLPALPVGEYYWHQLEGLAVVTAAGIRLGVVDHLIETGSNDVLVVRGDAESLDRRERLLPYLPDQVVKTIDLAAGQMIVDWDPEF